MPDIDIDAPGKSLLLMGNEAIARGALEAGIGFAASYPGTPSSEILPAIAGVARKRNIYAQWSVNETVALESAAGAALAGIRSLASMKQNGVQVASDFLGTLPLRSAGSGLVLVSCDDPEGRNSGSGEMDTRPVAKWLDIPLLEPGDMQEAKDMTKWLFDVSEELDIVCMLRCVSKISHSRGNVVLGELPGKEHKAYFDIKKPARIGSPIGMHIELLQKIEKAREIFESAPFNRYVGPDKPELLIITCGASWLHSQEAVKAMGLTDRVGILKLGTLYPLPEKFCESYLGKSQNILIVEEIAPFIERSVMELTANLPALEPRPVFYGKRSGHIRSYGELNPDVVIEAISKIMGVSYQSRSSDYDKQFESAPKNYSVTRTGGICPGCSHKAAHWAIKEALKRDGREGFETSDIGCYTNGLGPDGFYVAKTLYCMGGGAGVANGLGNLGQFGFNQPILAATGDSTFFHAVMPSLVNGVYNQSNFILVVLDNSATSMTGFQPHPGTGQNAMGESAPVVSIEAVCRSLGIRVEVCDPYDLEKTTDILADLMAMESGVRVIIMNRECELLRARRDGPLYKVHVDAALCLGEACVHDNVCRTWHCTALLWNKEEDHAWIDPVICAGCGVCVDICPQGAIIKEVVE
jgi:indolepyruvate ferredoxin oxidoreductase alpha subunit